MSLFLIKLRIVFIRHDNILDRSYEVTCCHAGMQLYLICLQHREERTVTCRRF
jgi:hypothetical protein